MMEASLFHISMAHKYIIRAHKRALEYPINNTLLRHRRVHRARQ